jgi:tetratricopeptide (TPR) repeat protein
MSKLALAIIAKDEVAQLKRIIDAYSQYFDEIAIAYDDDVVAKEIAENDKVKLFKYEWQDDFAHKRNFLASKIQSDYYFRLDTDDEIVHPELIKEAFLSYIKNGFTEVFVMYYYGYDENGVCKSRHWRETIIKNDGNLYWNKAIHENLLPRVPRKRVSGKETKIWLEHKCTAEEYQQSAERNLKMLMKEYEETKDKPDPRTVGYIARMFLGTKRVKEAIPFFYKFIETSGWDDDKYFAWNQLAECYLLLEQLDQALTCCVEAVLLNPYYPDAYFHFLATYFDMKDYNKAIEWGKLGFAKKTPDHMLNMDDAAYTWRPTAQLGMCYINIGRFKEGMQLLNKAHQLAPKDKQINDAIGYFGEIYRDDEMVKSYIALMQYCKGDLRKFRSLVDSFPRQIANDERLLVLKNMVEPGKVWDDKSVVFFCGSAWEDWVDSSVVGGIGGSEEATIYLSRELTKLGYKVTIFNQCGELAGEYRGVTYKNFYDFNPKDEFNIVISWRHNIFEKKVKAKKRIIWLHDVPGKDQFLSEESDTYDKVIVLSQFHKSLLKNVPEEKIYVSRNGLNMADFENIVEERNPQRMIYASSYDRGLQPFLKYVYPEVLKEVPEVELHIFYGWNTYDAMIKEGRRSQEWKDEMVKLMNQRGVAEHGRIGHKRLAKEYFKSGIWAYPTNFEEISCIGGMRAQVCGSVPVVNDYAALKETVRWGIKNEGDVTLKETYDNYAKFLISILKDPQKQEEIRKEMMPQAKELFSWQGVAEDWKTNLFS